MKQKKPNRAKILVAISTICRPIFENYNITPEQIAAVFQLDIKEKQPNLLTANQTAELLKCSPKTLANKRTLGCMELPFIKNGSRVLYRSSDVEKYILANTKLSTSQE